MTKDHTTRMRRIAEERRAVLMPGVPNALAARIVDDLGFEALYLTGAGLTNMSLGLPDLAFIDLSQLVGQVMAIRGITDLPMLVDADTGFGNAINVTRAVRTLEQAGASAIQIEDQHSPKRCGHFSGKGVVPVGEMVGKIKAAVDARREGMLICARTDAIAVDGFESAIERAERYIEAGADLTFVEAPTSVDDLARVPPALGVPQVANFVLGGRTPIVDQAVVAAMGFGLVLYANAALQGAIVGMQAALGTLREQGRLEEADPRIASFAERQRLVGKPAFDAMDHRYSVAD